MFSSTLRAVPGASARAGAGSTSGTHRAGRDCATDGGAAGGAPANCGSLGATGARARSGARAHVVTGRTVLLNANALHHGGEGRTMGSTCRIGVDRRSWRHVCGASQRNFCARISAHAVASFLVWFGVTARMHRVSQCIPEVPAARLRSGSPLASHGPKARSAPQSRGCQGRSPSHTPGPPCETSGDGTSRCSVPGPPRRRCPPCAQR